MFHQNSYTQIPDFPNFRQDDTCRLLQNVSPQQPMLHSWPNILLVERCQNANQSERSCEQYCCHQICFPWCQKIKKKCVALNILVAVGKIQQKTKSRNYECYPPSKESITVSQDQSCFAPEDSTLNSRCHWKVVVTTSISQVNR